MCQVELSATVNAVCKQSHCVNFYLLGTLYRTISSGLQFTLFTYFQTFLRATAECFARLSHRLGVRLSVTLVICIKTVQTRITKSLLRVAPKTLVYRDKILCSWVRGSPRTRASKGVPPKRCYFAVIGSHSVKRLQISTGDRLFRFINIDDLERP